MVQYHLRPPEPTRRWLTVVTVVPCLAAAACGGTAPPPAAPPSNAAGSSGAPLNTLAARAVGDRLIATASVVSVITDHAFVISDADLPDRGVLVLGGTPGGIRLKSLVTVSGRIDRFAFDRFAAAYGLGSPGPFRRFDERKIIVADDVHSWA